MCPVKDEVVAVPFILWQDQYLLEVPGLKFVSRERRDPGAGGGRPALSPLPSQPQGRSSTSLGTRCAI